MTRQARILVVDDDPTLRETLAEVLRDDGFDVRGAGDGREALARLDGWRADLVILDLMMPVMDAYAFRDALRRSGRLAPILIVSAAPRLDEAARRLNAAGVIAKPFRIRDLRAAVDRALSGRSRATSAEPA